MIAGTDGRWSWHIVGRNHVDAATYAQAISDAIDTRTRWRRQYEAAKERAGPPPALAMASAGTFGNSATTEATT